MTLNELIARRKRDLNSKIREYNDLVEELDAARAGESPDAAVVDALRERKAALGEATRSMQEDVEKLERELDADEKVAARQAEVTDVPEAREVAARAPVTVTSEKRTYNAHEDPKGLQFALDVARQFQFNDPASSERLARHMKEERVERGDKLVSRAVGTSAFSGLTVPQYLVDEFAPAAKASRPFADACRPHALPAKGMTLSIGKVTTSTSVDNQASENANVSETDIDDSLIPVPVQTAAGSQTISRQAIERGEGIEDTTIDDLVRGYATNLDSKLLNQVTTGLSAVAAAIAYTDGTPTATELYPKLLAGPAAVEALLLDQGVGDTIAVMHSRRWYWLQSQLTSTWPLFGQPGVAAQLGGVNYAERYGAGFRGVLPSGTPVIVDNNIGTAFGAGTNEDEIYFGGQSEFHLWEDPAAPMLIRAEQPKAKSLGVDLVVYGYFAYLFTRRVHAQKVAGTGLVTPVF
ncbi:phage major capsid protein [Cellulomonas oligotrophica]|uniref:HK97 family phage major capsid protein n=1 Tax=Cellulomonas oligotrophica TaxID=931536 RepID=A0A7Y9FKL8_9CELL|nr:phage major capsid protein [Cellulomonas oligotrophica]NYD87781.1 HK97 family phage major capsid protein [Cellulomonas oligotrophica]GIG33015.1 hypothetical protein Col01nite_21740 [Cellulomonas oligotrophica]